MLLGNVEARLYSMGMYSGRLFYSLRSSSVSKCLLVLQHILQILYENLWLSTLLNVLRQLFICLRLCFVGTKYGMLDSLRYSDNTLYSSCSTTKSPSLQ